jgi:hypothetical protein
VFGLIGLKILRLTYGLKSGDKDILELRNCGVSIPLKTKTKDENGTRII